MESILSREADIRARWAASSLFWVLVATQEPVEVGGHVTFVRDLVTFVGLLVPLECLDENLPDFSRSVVLGRVAEISARLARFLQMLLS